MILNRSKRRSLLRHVAASAGGVEMLAWASQFFGGVTGHST
jgi:hypothetical protein